MILLDIKRYIRDHQQVSADDLKNRFDLDDSALEGILAPLIQQGHIQSVSSEGGSCSTGGCNSGCGSAAKQMYYWTSKRLKTVGIPIQTY
ncbi:FeoC-like transcriptional regulator [Hydrogenovibrio kuenenii]|uniref:FeoC-like transcriptional regulator n=1 Tax=Hydrogenovibrio kuenenii TaxID=63658 RepID=UPI00046316B2|nr:FeoC-like transcriptional regulator [Hydrogenovibrio kuenenii]